MTNVVRSISASLVALAITACATDSALVDGKGACKQVFKGEVCTWSKAQGKNLVEVGADVPLASIENSPAEGSMAWPPVSAAVLDLPATSRQSSGLMNLTMYWEAMGHPPGPYMTPHFDFHFNVIPSADIAAIDCKDESKPGALPAGYGLIDVKLPPDMAKATGVGTLVGLCVPGMGMHSLLTSEMESKDPFRGSMVVGYYHGKPIFIEPMLTKAMLMEKKSFDLAIPDVPGLAVAHPTKFHAEFDATKQSYRFVFSDFKPAA